VDPSTSIGTEWLIDASGCAPETLRNEPNLRALLRRVIGALDLHVVSEAWHTFPGAAGVTGFYLLSESHLACHTYPEIGAATFNLYCCRPRRAFDWEDELRRVLSAERVIVRAYPRGAPKEKSR